MAALGQLDILAAALKDTVAVSINQTAALNAPAEFTIVDLDSLHKLLLSKCWGPVTQATTGSTAPAPPNPNTSASSQQQLTINVRMLSGRVVAIKVTADMSVSDVKLAIQQQTDIPRSQQKLILAGHRLDEARKLSDYNIKSNALIHMIIHVVGGVNPTLNVALLDSGHDYDFTNIVDGNKVFSRGNERYFRPCGWRRFALKVLGRYGGDAWLAADNSGWPVSYHGTSYDESGASMADAGYKSVDGSVQVPFERGVYSSPDQVTAARFGQVFQHGGINYKILIQNRINPATLVKLAGGFWVVPDEMDVRPYGFCIKRI